MPYLTKADLSTHIYPEITDIITRTDDSIVARAIKSGIGQAKGYLTRYDIVAMFGTDTEDPTFQEDFLDMLVKDLVCWHLIKLSNPNINLELFRASYEDAIKFLEKASLGKTDNPWPLRTDTTIIPGEDGTMYDPGGENINNGIDLSGHIAWNSNRRRSQHW